MRQTSLPMVEFARYYGSFSVEASVPTQSHPGRGPGYRLRTGAKRSPGNYRLSWEPGIWCISVNPDALVIIILRVEKTRVRLMTEKDWLTSCREIPHSSGEDKRDKDLK
jgi:hypothetical protein